MNRLAIIPARGGSKRLPRKNTLPFLGKPILIWTCEAARNSEDFTDIFVSTEDPVIAELTKKFGFSVLERRQNLATDQSSCVEVCLDALAQLERKGKHYDVLSCLYATAPLRNAKDISNTISLLEASSPPVDAVFAITDYFFAPHQMLIEDNDHCLQPAHPLLVNLKSQQIPSSYCGNGSTYTIWVDSFLKYQSFYCPRVLGYHMPRMRSIDINNQEDFDIAICFAKHLLQEK